MGFGHANNQKITCVINATPIYIGSQRRGNFPGSRWRNYENGNPLFKDILLLVIATARNCFAVDFEARSFINVDRKIQLDD